MSKIYIKTKFIDKLYLESRPEEEMGFDYDEHDDFVNQVEGKQEYIVGGLVKIDEIIKNLQTLKEAGSNYVDIDFHEDHQELEITGFDVHRMSEKEILEYELSIRKNDSERKQKEISELEAKLQKLKSEI